MGRQFILIIFLLFWNMLWGQPGTVKISQEKIENAVRQYVEKHIPSTAVKYAVENIRIPNLYVREAGAVSIEVDRTHRTALKGLCAFRVKINSAEKTLKVVAVNARVRIWEKVCILDRTVRKDEMMRPEMLRKEIIETTKLAGGVVYEDTEVIGKKTIRTLRNGDILYSRFLANMPIILKGEQVILVYTLKNIRVTVRAKALSEGAVGDMIWVKNLQSGKRLKARVSQKGVVILQ